VNRARVSPTSAGFAANSHIVYPGEALKRKHKFSGHVALSGAAAATLMLAVPDASALGLGRLSVQSALGESLQAEIEITSMSAEEAANLRAIEGTASLTAVMLSGWWGGKYRRKKTRQRIVRAREQCFAPLSTRQRIWREKPSITMVDRPLAYTLPILANRYK